MKILVTGNEGYIGTVLTPMLVRDGHDVTGLDAGYFSNCCFTKPDTGIRQIRKDIRHVEREDFEGYDAVIHLAALCNDPLSNLNEQLTIEINYKGTLRVAELAKSAGVKRFLFSSSCSTYGAAGDNFLDETAPTQPVTVYGRTKVMAEQGIAELADDDFTPVYLRNATVFGFSPRLRLDLVLNEFAASAFLFGRILIKSDGTPWRPMVHVEDVSRVFVSMLGTGRDVVHNQAFNVGSYSQNYRVRELADVVAEVCGHCAIEYADDAGPDLRCYRVDCSKLTRALPDFEMKWNARRGAQELLTEFRAGQFTSEDFESRAFRRLAQICALLETGELDSQLQWKMRNSTAMVA